MPPWLKTVIELLSGHQLRQFWFLVAGFLGVYAIAWILARTQHGLRTTRVAKARRAWGIAFVFHSVATMAVIVLWYHDHRASENFVTFFAFFIALLGFDLVAAVSLLFSARRFRVYLS